MSDSGDSGRIGALESRVAILEAQMGYLSSRAEKTDGKLDAHAERLTRAEERILHLPTKELLVKVAVGTVAVATAIIAFQEKIRLLFKS